MSEVTCPAREWRCDLARQIAVPAYRSTAKASDRVGVAHPPEDGTDGRREGGLGRRPPEATRRIRLSDEASPASGLRSCGPTHGPHGTSILSISAAIGCVAGPIPFRAACGDPTRPSNSLM